MNRITVADASVDHVEAVLAARLDEVEAVLNERIASLESRIKLLEGRR